MADAIRWAEAKMLEVNKPKLEITLREFADGFFTERDPHGYRHRLERRNTFYDESYYLAHQARLDNHILPAHGAYLLSSLRDTLIEDFILDLPRLANSTKNKVLSCYRIVLREAVREGYISDNPADKVVELPANDAPRQAFTQEEVALFFPADDEELIRLWSSPVYKDGLRFAVYFLIQKDTGWRPCEVSALQKINYFPEMKGIYTTSDVNWRTRQIQPRIKTSRKGQKFKSGFLTDQTARLLEQLINTCKDDYLFRLPSGDFITPDKANYHLRATAERAGVFLNGRTQYSFRHTFNTYALGNIPEQARLILMGHSSNRQEYNHLTPEQALGRVLSLLSDKKEVAY